jgi:hypothetical protein
MIAKIVLQMMLGAALIAAGTAAQAATLVGDRTYATTGDLTRIDDGGALLDFLDLTVTKGQTVATATGTYGGDGFAVANAAQITALLDAFGIVYAFNPGSFADLGASGASAAAFGASLGITYAANASLGTYAESAGSGPYSYLCISSGDCSAASFTGDSDLSSGDSILGVFLVRAAVSDVPLPAALPLLAVGIAGLTLLGRRRA